MDATRSRRTRDDARQRWYAAWRCQRFARHFGFASGGGDAPAARGSVAYFATRVVASAACDAAGNGSWELLLCSY